MFGLCLTMMALGQDGVSFDALFKKLDDKAIPTYYLETELYTGTTIDSFHRGEKVYYYKIHKGKIQQHTAYSYDGKLVRDFNYEGGLLHGKITSYFGNGQKYYEDQYKKGLREGTQLGWYKDGSPRYVIECMSGGEISRIDYPKPDKNDDSDSRSKRN